MTNSFIKMVIVFSIGFASGAYFACKKMEEKYQAKADEQIEDMKEAFKEKESHMQEIIEEKSQKMAVDYALQHINLEREDGSSIYDTSSSGIEIIEPENFGELDDYETSFLTYYNDGFLTYDSDGSVVEDILGTVGPDALNNIGKYMPSMVHVRNHFYKKDYEITQSFEKYRDNHPLNGGEEDD